MQIINQLDILRDSIANLRKDGARIGLVPTMGALHAGHLSLVERLREHCDAVVASIFVNPKQFGAGEDLDAYPRTLQEDAEKLKAEGVAALWAPSPSEMYPSGFATRVAVDGLTEDFCGSARTGHFDGVALVVAKLFNQVQPNIAIFGEKDWQQLAVIRQMARDLDFNLDIIGAPIMRSEEGLALSSRNRYLSDAEYKSALTLPRALNEAAEAIRGGGDIKSALDTAVAKLKLSGFDEPDYIALVDEKSLQRLTKPQNSAMRILAAAKIGQTRLLDNLAV